VERKFPQVTLIKSSENLGFARGNNLGLRSSHGEYICLLNSDTKLMPGCLDRLTDYMEGHPGIGMLGPKILNADLSHQSSCRQFPNLWNNFCSAAGLTRLFPRSKFFSGEHMCYFAGNQARDVDVLVGCFWLVRREALRQFGVLDEQFFMYGEDLDWCKRCWKAGWRVAFFPEAEAIHFRAGSSSNRDVVWVELMQQRSVIKYWKKHHSYLGVLGLRCLLLGSRLLRWGAGFLAYCLERGERARNKTSMRVNWACLGDILLARGDEALSAAQNVKASSC
jgi:GT2 family glycosyltransferase